jgi:hypothetical protein
MKIRALLQHTQNFFTQFLHPHSKLHLNYCFSQSLIDLYTVEGQKVTTPIEIINQNTYVAVLPQDSFISGGYTEYLLKATRYEILFYSGYNESIYHSLTIFETCLFAKVTRKKIGKIEEKRERCTCRYIFCNFNYYLYFKLLQ